MPYNSYTSFYLYYFSLTNQVYVINGDLPVFPAKSAH